MRSLRLLVAGLSLAVTTACPLAAAEASSMGPFEAVKIAKETYIYGYQPRKSAPSILEGT